MANLSMQTCQAAVEVVTFLPYRLVRLSHLLEGCISLPLHIYVLAKLMRNLPFHNNLKILMSVYYCNVTFFSVMVIFAEIWHLWLSLTFVSPCDVILPQSLYPYISLTIHYPSISYVWFQAAICIERTVATVVGRSYENNSVRLGVTLSILANLSPVVIYLLQHYDSTAATWSSPVFYFYKPPPGVTDRVSLHYNIGIATSSLAMTTICILYIINRRSDKRALFHTVRRYHLAENAKASYFVCWICFLSLSNSLVYYGGMSLVGHVTEGLTDKNAIPTTLRNAVFTSPAYSLMLPVQIILLVRSNRKEQKKLREQLTSEVTTGHIGTQNYEDIITKQWK